MEKDPAAARLIQANVELLRLDKRAQLKQHDALVFLKHPPAKPYDVVFLDPPYASDLLEKVLPLLNQPAWLSPTAMIFIEHSTHQTPPALLSSGALAWEKLRQGTAGEVSYSLYHATNETHA